MNENDYVAFTRNKEEKEQKIKIISVLLHL